MKIIIYVIKVIAITNMWLNKILVSNERCVNLTNEALVRSIKY